jgi:hypothetical protein
VGWDDSLLNPQASLWAEMTINSEGEKEEEAAAAAAAEVEVEEEVEMEAVAVVMATLPWLQIWRQGWIRHRFFFGKGSSRSRILSEECSIYLTKLRELHICQMYATLF